MPKKLGAKVQGVDSEDRKSNPSSLYGYDLECEPQFLHPQSGQMMVPSGGSPEKPS